MTPFAKAEDSNVIPIKNMMDMFLSRQFGGDLGVWEEDQKFVEFSPKRKKIETKRDPEFGGTVISVTGDSLIIVNSYLIQEVKKLKNKYEIKVRISQVAVTSGEGDLNRVIIKNQKFDKEVIYYVIHKLNGWRVVDPPLPIISIDSLISSYKSYIVEYKKFIDKPQTSEPQKQQYKAYLNSLAVLENIKIQQ